MDALQVTTGTAHSLAALFSITLACLVLRVRSRSKTNRLLAALLGAEAGFQLVMALVTVFDIAPGPGEEASRWDLVASLFPLALLSIGVASILYLLFLASLDTPLTRPFRNLGVRRALVALMVVGAAAVLAIDARALVTGEPISDAVGSAVFLPTLTLMVFASGYGLAVCVSAWRRAAPGTAERRRAWAFALAFGGRDVAFLGHVILGPILGNLIELPLLIAIIGQSLLGVATILFASFLAYGILQTQLFDIDLKLKVGIRRSTVVTVIVVVALAAAKVAEFYLNSTYGFVAGGVAAGMMLFLAPRLNRVGERVANTAMPKVQPTSDYLAYKKLEVYKAAVETALEDDGEIDPRERAMLDRLRASLDLAPADAEALEAEARGRRAPSNVGAPA